MCIRHTQPGEGAGGTLACTVRVNLVRNSGPRDAASDLTERGCARASIKARLTPKGRPSAWDTLPGLVRMFRSSCGAVCCIEVIVKLHIEDTASTMLRYSSLQPIH